MAWLLAAIAVTAVAEDALPPVTIEPALDLRAEGRAAARDCVPLVLEFSADFCSYCERLEEEILKPILRNRDYDRRVRIRKVHLGRHTPLKDFDGRRTDSERLAQRYRVWVTPTLLFLDRDGQQLAEPMVGINTVEFYGGYLDQAIDQARAKLCPGS